MNNDINETLQWDDLKREAPEWFRDAKFGLFFHWGPYSVPAYKNEWYSRNMYAKGNDIYNHHQETFGPVSEFGYKDFYPMMTGDRFDPEEWADLVELSGAKYAGPVTEHADNFSMWDSQVNPINAVKEGPHRDVFGECAEAFRKRGIKVLATFHHQWLWGWFMSSDPDADVYNPANEKYYWKSLPLETSRYMPYQLPDASFNQMWMDRINEVVDKYHPDAIYFDSRTCIIDERVRKEMTAHYYQDKNAVITYKQEDFPMGVGIYDIERGNFSEAKEFPWQTDDRLEDQVTWCMVQEPKYKSAKRIIHQLCDVVSKNGNLLLNIGPYADGSFHPEAKRILGQVGGWLKINGEAIYGTRPYKVPGEGETEVLDSDYDIAMVNAQLEDGADEAEFNITTTFKYYDVRFTQKGDAIYAIVMGWPGKTAAIETLGKNGTNPQIHSVELLGYGPLKWKQTDEALLVNMPKDRPEHCKYGYALKVL